MPTTGPLRVRRKTKRLVNKSVWWFVVHGSESDLALLDQSWGKIQSQTLWSLQECYMPAASQPVSASVSENVDNVQPNPDELEQPVIESNPDIDAHEASSSAVTTHVPNTPTCTLPCSFLVPSQS